MRKAIIAVLAPAVGFAALCANVVLACPFCSAPSLTLAEQLDQADVCVLVEWHSGDKGRPDDPANPGSTTYRIVQVVKAGTTGKSQAATAASSALKKGGLIVLPRYREASAGDLFLLMGSRGNSIQWGSPQDISQAAFKYLTEAPPRSASVPERLKYYVQFLEHPERLIGDDAYAEFANAPYEDIARIKDSLDRARIRRWIENPQTPVTRISLYGLLLGLCGNADDAAMLEARILQPTQEYRLGIEGLMSGYLVLTGADGLAVLDRTKFASKIIVDKTGRPIPAADGSEQALPFSETYAAMQAIRFMWQYGENRISPDRLRQSMRILLDRPDLADLVIADLARWEDWEVRDRIIKLYGQPEYDVPAVKRAIVRYLIVCSKKGAAAAKGAAKPQHVIDAEAALKRLRETDPDTVRRAERFFTVN